VITRDSRWRRRRATPPRRRRSTARRDRCCPPRSGSRPAAGPGLTTNSEPLITKHSSGPECRWAGYRAPGSPLSSMVTRFRVRSIARIFIRTPGTGVSTHSPSAEVIVWWDGAATLARSASRTVGDGDAPLALAAISTLASYKDAPPPRAGWRQGGHARFEVGARLGRARRSRRQAPEPECRPGSYGVLQPVPHGDHPPVDARLHCAERPSEKGANSL
jgi:hypothetical protein